MKVLGCIRKGFSVFVGAFAAQMKMILHDSGILLFIFFLPLVYPILYSLIYNPELVRDVKMVVVDHDMTPLSREYVRKINATEGANVIGYAAEMGEARHAMNSHKCYGILEIPEGFEKKARSGEGTQAILYAEMSLLLRYRALLVSCTDVSLDMGAELLAQNINTEAPIAKTYVTGDIMGIESVFMGNLEAGFDSFVMPGVLILILHQCIILIVGMAGGARHEYPRRMGLVSRGENPHTIAWMAGQTLCFFVVFILPLVWLIYYVPLIFHFPMAGNPWEEILFLVPMMLACIFLGLCLQSLVLQREEIFVIWVVTSIIFLFLSGLTWPRFAMPEFWQIVGDLAPGTWGVEGFIRMNTNGATLGQTAPDFKALWILAGAYFVLAYLLQRFVMRPSILRKSLLQEAQSAREADSAI